MEPTETMNNYFSGEFNVSLFILAHLFNCRISWYIVCSPKNTANIMTVIMQIILYGF